MNEQICWFCKRQTDIKNDDYGDHKCPFCNVQISIYNPDRPDWKPEVPITTDEQWLKEGEEEMAVDYGNEKYQGKYIYMPRVGETLVIEIKEVREKKSDNPKLNFSEKTPVMANGEQVVDDDSGEPIFKEKDLGFHIEAELTSGKILAVTSFSQFSQVFKKYEINDGDKVKIFHKGKGEWEVNKI